MQLKKRGLIVGIIFLSIATLYSIFVCYERIYAKIDPCSFYNVKVIYQREWFGAGYRFKVHVTGDENLRLTANLGIFEMLTDFDEKNIVPNKGGLSIMYEGKIISITQTKQ